MSDRRTTHWEEKLLPGDTSISKEDGRELKVVLLKGLQRLAHEAGLCRSHCAFTFITATDTGTDFGIMQAVYTAEFDDGSKWVGAADCNAQNTDAKFRKYPTAVAESRAEARCLRKALNIGMLSFEEIAFGEQIEISPNQQIDSQVVKAIEKLCEARNVTLAELLEVILSKERNSAVFEINELTVEEGQKAMGWLNEQRPSTSAKKKPSAVEERDARKKELVAKVGEDSK